MMNDDIEVLVGGDEIQEYTNRLLRRPLTKRQLYRAIELGKIPINGKLGSRFITTRGAIRRALGIEDQEI